MLELLRNCGSDLLETLQRREPKGSAVTGLLPRVGKRGHGDLECVMVHKALKRDKNLLFPTAQLLVYGEYFFCHSPSCV